MPLLTRAAKGSALTHNELDANFTGLDTRTKLIEGVSPAAPAGSRFVSDGAGGGEHIRIAGFGHYRDSDLIYGTPDQELATGVRTLMTIDSLGTVVEKLPSDAGASLWNDTTNAIAPIAEFDTYSIRLGFAVQGYAGSTPQMLIELDIGGALGTIWERSLSIIKGGNEQFISPSFSIYAGSTFLANGGKFYLTYVGGGGTTCAVYQKQLFVNRVSKNYV